MTVLPFMASPAERAGRPAARSVVTTVTLGLLVVAAVLPRVAFLDRPFESDAGLYIYMGKVLASGRQTLYRDFYETKLPGVPLLTAGLYRLFGNHWWPYCAVQLGMSVASALLLSRAVARSLGHGEGRAYHVPTLLFALTFLNFSPAAFRGFQLETVQTFFACGAAYTAVTALESRGICVRSTFLLGLFAGLAAMVKPSGGGVAGAFLIALLPHPRLLGRAVVTLAPAALVPAGAVLAWTWNAGLLPEMPGLFREISLYAGQTPLPPEEYVKLFVAALIGGGPFLLVRVCRPIEGPDGHDRRATLRTVTVFAAVWLALEVLGVVAQRRMYAYHFLPIAAPLSLLFGLACRAQRPVRAYLAALAPVLVLSLAWIAGDLGRLATQGVHRLPESEWLLAHAAPGDTVVGDPVERLLMETGLTCGARYAHLFYFGNHDAAPLEYGRRFLEDLERRKPRWAIFGTDRAAHHKVAADLMPIYALRPVRRANLLAAWEAIEAYLAARYEPAATVGEVTIYRRR